MTDLACTLWSPFYILSINALTKYRSLLNHATNIDTHSSPDEPKIMTTFYNKFITSRDSLTVAANSKPPFNFQLCWLQNGDVHMLGAYKPLPVCGSTRTTTLELVSDMWGQAEHSTGEPDILPEDIAFLSTSLLTTRTDLASLSLDIPCFIRSLAVVPRYKAR